MSFEEVPLAYHRDRLPVAIRRSLSGFMSSVQLHRLHPLSQFAQVAAQLKGRVDFIGVDSQDTDGPGMAMARSTGIDSWPLARDVGLDGRDYHDAPWVVGALDLTVSNVVHPPSVHR